MLENEQTAASSADTALPLDTARPLDDGLPKPPAGRRSRRRPAGPPAEAAAPAERTAEVAPVETPAAEVVAAEPVEETETAPAAEFVAAEPEVAADESAVEADAEANELIEIEAVAEHADEAATEQPDDETEATHETTALEAEAEPTEGEGEEADEGEETQASTAPRRRRRRRGGRRRHGGEGGQATADAEESDETTEGEQPGAVRQAVPQAAAEGVASETTTAEAATTEGATEQGETAADQTAVAEQAEAADQGEGEAASSGSSRRRRRRRRRRGEDASTGSEDDPSEVVVKVREPHAAAGDQIRAVEGSTRLEAKRQRRREGRAAGRRRAPIVSESEFLARRESVTRQMVVRQGEEYSQIAVLEDGVLVEHYVDRESSSSLIGNIYLGKVQNVLPSMEAAFIDIGRGRNAVLYAGEVDWDAYGSGHSERRIENVLKSGQTVVVQVTKDPVGAKGARLTNHVSLPGRYVVYAPGGHLSGISRKLPDVERKRLKHILAELIEEGASVIVRTAAEGATQEQLVHDVSRLKSQWDTIENRAKHGGAPQLLYSEPDLTIRTVRDLFTEDFAELIIDGDGEDDDAYDTLADYLTHTAPHLADRVVHWDRAAKGDVFAHYRLDEQIAKALERKVHLPSGGSLVIDRTEAMTVIDVNTGKFTGHGGNLEATVTANNLEAAEEIVRQLRLRDVGGIIVIDFIDMVLPSNRELLLRRLVECLGRDRTRHQVSEVTSLGLVQLTRKKIGTGLAEAFTEPCEVCNNRGYLIHDMPVATQAPADGGDRQGRNSRKRSRGKSTGQASVPTPAPTPAKETEAEQVSVEARAAAQAAMNAVAHAGSKPKVAEPAVEAEDRTAPAAPVSEGHLEQATETPVEAVAEALTGAGTSSRSRRSSRSRGSRRPAGAPGAAAEEVSSAAGSSEPVSSDAGEARTAVPQPVAAEARVTPLPEAPATVPATEAPASGGTAPADALAEIVAALVAGGEEAPALIDAAPAEAPAAKKSTTRTSAAKKSTAKTTAKKSTARKATAKKAVAGKAPAGAAVEKAVTEAALETVTVVTPEDAPAVEKPAAKKAAARKTTAKKATAKKTTARKTTKRAAATPATEQPVTGQAAEPDAASSTSTESTEAAATSRRTTTRSTRKTAAKATSGSGTRSRARKAAADPTDAPAALSTDAPVQDAFVPAPVTEPVQDAFVPVQPVLDPPEGGSDH